MSARDVIARAARQADPNVQFSLEIADVAIAALTAAGLAIYDTRTHAAVPREIDFDAACVLWPAFKSIPSHNVSQPMIEKHWRAYLAYLAAAEAEAKEGGDVG